MATEKIPTEAQLHQQLADAQQEGEQLRRQLDREVGTLNRLIQLSTLLNSTLDVEQLLPLIMKSAKDLLDAGVTAADLAPMAIGLAVSAVVGYLVIAFLLAWLRRRTLTVFVVYRLLLAGLILAVVASP